MKNLLKRLVEWLSPTLTDERTISLLVQLRTRYTQFRLLSPDLQMEICSILDEKWRILPEYFKKELMRDQGVVLEESDVVPRLDYESLKKANVSLQEFVCKAKREREAALEEASKLRYLLAAYQEDEEIAPEEAPRV